MRIACIYFEKPEDTQSLAEIFYRLTPQIMLRGERAIFLEISKCRTLYSEETFLKKVRLTLARLKVSARLALADDVSTALAQAVFNNQNKDQLPIESLKFYIDPLAEDLEGYQKIEKMKEALAALGIRRLGDFRQLTHRDLTQRFGQMGLMAKLRVQNETAVVWRNFTARQEIFETFEFDLESPVENLEPIFFRLKATIDKLVLRLRGLGQRLKKFDVILHQEHALKKEHLDYTTSILMQMPQVTSAVVFAIVREMIEAQVRKTPLKARVTGFTVFVREVVPYRMSQKDLFDQKREESEESLYQFVSRVSTRIGGEAVFFAKTQESFLPEKNWQRSSVVKTSGETKPTAEAVSPVPTRPLRLFSSPQRVQICGERVVAENLNEEIDMTVDKEIIFSDWWTSPLERTYFRLITKSGKNLWLFRNREGHFLHGIFD